jgi:hypothetical protein
MPRQPRGPASVKPSRSLVLMEDGIGIRPIGIGKRDD